MRRRKEGRKRIRRVKVERREAAVEEENQEEVAVKVEAGGVIKLKAF